MKYEYWYANIKVITNKRKREIREGIKNILTLYYIEETALQNYPVSDSERVAIIESIRNWKLDDSYKRMVDKGVKMITITEESYPERLRYIASPPYALYIKGKLPQEKRMTAAIVGARECSPYGEAMAKKFAESLATAGVQSISGMARGVDGASQRGAINVGGDSYAVLGCGVDICYPRDQIDLYMDLQDHGGILSEYPIGTEPVAKHFPARNRIISGLSDIVLVIEAKKRSGSLITADMALEQGKDVYALPGPVTSHLCRGCNELIRQGAGILLSPKELLEELNLSKGNRTENSGQKKLLLESAENIVYSLLDFQPRSLEYLLRETKMTVSELLDILMSLQLRGLVSEISKNYYAVVEETF